MKIAVSQINTTIGDFDGNANRMISQIDWAAEQGADLVVFPELTTCGYPPRDLLEKQLFVQRNLECVERVAEHNKDVGVVLGFVSPNESQTGRGLYNAAALLHGGRVEFVQEKSLLPNYDVFDETRYFEPAQVRRVHQFKGVNVALSLCEDLWSEYTFEGRILYASDPIQDYANMGAQIIINISASPYVIGKAIVREKLAGRAAHRFGIPVVYCNLIGGNDELIFDGQSIVVNTDGHVVHRAKQFEEDHFIIDVDKLPPECPSVHVDDVLKIKGAIILGLRDYLNKCGFSSAVFGLSGGVDSAVVACLAAEAIGAENVTAVIMPSQYSSESSIRDAKYVADKLGIRTRTIHIGDIYESYRKTLGFNGSDSISVAEENLQARARGNVLMAISNREGAIVLSTGNKSEMAVGYCTLYGDMAGGLAVISDVPKTMVFKLAQFYHDHGGFIPMSIIEKPPSAELKPDQTDQDSLPPYEVLDQILKLYIEEHMSSHAIIELGHDAETVKKVVKMVELNEYKRRQAPPGFKVTSKAFGVGRRFPIARKIYW